MNAQEEEESKSFKDFIDVSGSLDAYFRTNLNANYDLAPGTAFANLPGFSLGMANLILAKEGEKVGFVGDFVLGPRGEDATFLSPILRPNGNSSIVNQLYVYWNINDKITTTFGNFNTFLGYEVIAPTGNFNYSTSYMFSYGPFSHTGLKFDFALHEDLSLMVGAFNATDATEYNIVSNYVLGAQLGYSKDKGSIYLNTLYDNENEFFQVDITAGMDITDDFYAGLNSTIATDNFLGVAAYLQYGINDDFDIGTRIEYFKDTGLGLFAEDDSVLDFTITGKYKIGDLSIMPEIRTDIFSSDILLKEATFNDNGSIDKEAVTGKALASFVLAVVYEF